MTNGRLRLWACVYQPPCPAPCYIILASEHRKQAPEIAKDVDCNADSVLDIIHAFNHDDTQALRWKSSCPHATYLSFAADQGYLILQYVPPTSTFVATMTCAPLPRRDSLPVTV